MNLGKIVWHRLGRKQREQGSPGNGKPGMFQLLGVSAESEGIFLGSS